MGELRGLLLLSRNATARDVGRMSVLDRTARARVRSVLRIQRRYVRWQMTSQIHRVVQDPHDVNSRCLIAAIQHEVAATPPSSSHMEATQARLDLVARPTVWKVGSVVKRCERGNQRASVNQSLPSPKILRGPSDDSDEVALG
jgi:hypothetical protein